MMRRLLAAGALALTVTSLGAGSAQAQVAEVDPRWQAWVGCWQPAGPQSPGALPGTGLVCVIPADGQSAVDFVTIAGGAVETRERIDANGERRESVRNGCAGWEQAVWSEDGRRVYLRAEHACPGGGQRRASGMLAFSPGLAWIDVQAVAVGAYPGVRVVRYREATGDSALPDEVARALRSRTPDYWALRAAAGSTIGTAEVLEAGEYLDPIAMESWLVERGERFDLDAGRLMELADRGVPDRVIDVMVALSFPGVFTVNAAPRGGGARVEEAEQAPAQPGTAGYGGSGSFDDRYYSPFGWGPYAYGYGGYGYGGWYWGNRPIVIVVNPGAGGSGGGAPHGKVVNGRGYAGGDNTGPLARPSNPGSTGSGSVSGSGGYSQPQPHSSGSSGSGSSTSTGRTAHPRP